MRRAEFAFACGKAFATSTRCSLTGTTNFFRRFLFRYFFLSDFLLGNFFLRYLFLSDFLLSYLLLRYFFLSYFFLSGFLAGGLPRCRFLF